MWTFLALGLSMGLSAGVSTGPLLALVVAASLRSGLRGGVSVALAPLLTDLPIIALAVLVVARLHPMALRWVGTVGGLVVMGMGVEILRSSRKAELSHQTRGAASNRYELWRGMLVNVLNPHPYLFWATVGGPTLVSAWRHAPWMALAFLLPFYFMLVGSKVGVAWLVSSQADKLSATWYRRLLRACGALLLCVGGLFVYQLWAP